MKSITNTTIFLALFFFFTGCKKDKEAGSIPVTTPVLSVKLGQAYLVPGQVDSAFAEWATGGVQQMIKLERRNDSLLAAMNLFNEGSGELTIHIYSNKKYSNQYPGEFVFHKKLSLQKTKALEYKGPASFNDADWSPWVKLADAIGHEAVIALRPDDPYFMVGDPGHHIAKLTVERSYWRTIGGVQLMGQGIWECLSNCTNQPNRIFFSNLPAKIGTKPWNHISIIILFETAANGGGWVISLEHEP